MDIDKLKDITNRNIDTGNYLQKLRLNKKLTLSSASKSINISPTYLSDIEHGRKLPSDITIKNIAEFYEIDEIDLFNKFGKISLTVKELLLSDLNVPERKRLLDIFKEFLKHINRPKESKIKWFKW